ncbi:hypothetical protein DINM_000256 [Dirofilaria immitis]|nr:hypothetical protein [Dirofilaria immitis]
MLRMYFEIYNLEIQATILAKIVCILGENGFFLQEQILTPGTDSLSGIDYKKPFKTHLVNVELKGLDSYFNSVFCLRLKKGLKLPSLKMEEKFFSNDDQPSFPYLTVSGSITQMDSTNIIDQNSPPYSLAMIYHAMLSSHHPQLYHDPPPTKEEDSDHQNVIQDVHRCG